MLSQEKRNYLDNERIKLSMIISKLSVENPAKIKSYRKKLDKINAILASDELERTKTTVQTSDETMLNCMVFSKTI